VSSKNKAIVYRMVMDKHICPFGLKTIDLLKSKGYIIEDHHLTSHEETGQFREKHGVKPHHKPMSMRNVLAAMMI
jgi:glutaredoxin